MPRSSGLPASSSRPREIVPNGIDASAIERAGSRREEVRRTLSLNPGALLVVAIGRLEPVKDHATLLRAFAIAARQVPTLVLAIAGAGSLEGTLRSQATALEVAAKVRFLGHREDVPALLRAADLFAMTSLSEGLPLALVEALAAQLPAIASAIPGNLDALGTPCAGLVVAAGDHAALAQALVRLARDAPLRSDLSSLAGARARAFSRETMIDRHCLLYERLLAGRR